MPTYLKELMKIRRYGSRKRNKNKNPVFFSTYVEHLARREKTVILREAGKSEGLRKTTRNFTCVILK